MLCFMFQLSIGELSCISSYLTVLIMVSLNHSEITFKTWNNYSTKSLSIEKVTSENHY